MSNLPAKQVIEAVKAQSEKFHSLDAANGKLLDFEQECLFARQQILKNDFTLSVAANNPQSLQAAILNVAAIGISLNPASQHAYLVPRDKAICLDISYRGMVKLATDSGAIKWAKVELVHKNDTFKWRGPAEAPLHEADPFGERGEIIGGYCIAKLPDGEILTETMPVEEINKIRDTSKAFQKGGGPWKQWYDEMAKKTILKRAYKSWPQTPNRKRVDLAVEALHEVEGTAYTIDQHIEFMKLLQDGEAIKFFAFRHKVGDAVWIALYNSFEKGQKVKMKEKASALESEGIRLLNEYKDQLVAAANNGDASAATELLDELEGEEREFLVGWLPEETRNFINQLGAAA